ncbi:glycosyltransferase family 2 protein, partial [Streptomyces sp. SM12]
WIACTDADSRVPPGWLLRQARWAAAGWCATVGTVRPHGWPPELDAVVRRHQGRYRAALRPDTHPHVHGANLGVRASAYEDAGGFPDVLTGEDRALVAALADAGHRLLRTGSCPVATSARLTPRAVHGYGHDLARLAGRR